jgi:2-(1,2-epoxy-1,2-dihydrophenyl)acetyl-CoA isomerase
MVGPFSGTGFKRNVLDSSAVLPLPRKARYYYNPAVNAVRQSPKPLSAAVNGVVAAGAGANIALACDLVIARSARFQAFSKIGLIPDAGGTWMLPRLLVMHAPWLTFFWSCITKGPLEMGMIWKMLPDTEFDLISTTYTPISQQPTYALAFKQTEPYSTQ